MSQDWVADIKALHQKMGHTLKNTRPELLAKFLEFRIEFLQEELDELWVAEQPADVVDALIDLCVVAITTLDLLGVDAHLAWDRVFAANMTKVPGIKDSRPNPLGLPDLIKPVDWKDPEHRDNVGRIVL